MLVQRNVRYLGAAILLFLFTNVFAQLPHIVMGEIKNSDGSSPAANEIKITSYLLDEPEDFKIVYNKDGGVWSIECISAFQNGSSGWEAGKIIHLHFLCDWYHYHHNNMF